MAAEACGNAAHDDFKDAAKRIACLLCLIDLLFHPHFGIAVVAVELRARLRADCRPVDLRRIDRYAADRHDVRDDFHAEHMQKFLADRADCDAHRRLPRARTLQDIPHVLACILAGTRKIRVAGARRRDHRSGLRAKCRHARPPIGKVTIDDAKCDGTAQCLVEAYARKYVCFVRLDLHATAASISLLTAREITVDRVRIQGKPRRKPFDDRRQARSMRFPRRHKTQFTHTILLHCIRLIDLSLSLCYSCG